MLFAVVERDVLKQRTGTREKVKVNQNGRDVRKCKMENEEEWAQLAKGHASCNEECGEM